MAKLTDSEVNVSAIRRVDSLVKDLIDSATHVALYSFDAQKNDWEKTNIEGALFVYSRVQEPLYSMFVMNRNSPENMLEAIVKEMDLQLQNPFLLYKNKQGLIYGIWFYSDDDCRRISVVLQSLVKQLAQPPQAVPKKVVSDNKNLDASKANGSIMNMLTKAQEEYNSHKSPMKNEKSDLELAPKSVMDFFAKAGVSQAAETHLPQPPGYTPGIPVSHRPAYVIPPPVPATEVNHPIIQRIMSNPVHSVEHIEKQQRSVTPSGGSGIMKVANPNVPVELESNIIFMRISDSPSTTGLIPTQQFFNSNIAPQPISENIHMNGLEAVEVNKSALMPPTMFTSSSSKDAGEKLMNGILGGSELPPKHIEPLTKNQIIQAVSYLMKHDADFVNKLHEAYLNSFKDRVSI